MAFATTLIPELDEIVKHGDPKRRAEASRRIAELFLLGAASFRPDHVDLFDGETVSGFVEVLRELLQQAVTDPDSPILALALPRRAKGRVGTAANSITRRRQP